MIFKRKSILLVLAIVLMSMVVVACGSSDNGGTPAGSTPAGAGDGGASEVAGLTEAFAEQPTLLTSIGQSADVEMVKALMDNVGLEYTLDKSVTADGLGDAKTLILAVGGSSKGLGAAGIDAEDELKRTDDLIKAAKDNDVKIIAMHIGGENRRGELSDKFVDPAFKDADYIIIVEEGNKDGIFTNIATGNNIPMDIVASIADAVEPLQKAFK